MRRMKLNAAYHEVWKIFWHHPMDHWPERLSTLHILKNCKRPKKLIAYNICSITLYKINTSIQFAKKGPAGLCACMCFLQRRAWTVLVILRPLKSLKLKLNDGYHHLKSLRKSHLGAFAMDRQKASKMAQGWLNMSQRNPGSQSNDFSYMSGCQSSS